MTTKQVLFRLDDSKVIAFDKKLSDKGISKQFFLAKCVELFLDDKLSLDSSEITNDSSEIAEIKKQLAVILQRLDKLENDSKVIAVDNLLLDSVNPKKDNTENNTLSESSLMPLKEDSGQNIPDEELSPNIDDSPVIHTDSVCSDNDRSEVKHTKELTESQQKVINNIGNISTGEQLSYSKLAERLEVSRTVLDGFDLWKIYFKIVEKKRGCDYLKL